MTRSSRGTKLDVSAVGSEHQKRTAPRAVGAWCRRHGFHSSPLCKGREAIKLGGGITGRILDTNPKGRPSPDVRDALDLIWRGVIPSLMQKVTLQ